jgi:hypothetical protein
VALDPSQKKQLEYLRAIAWRRWWMTIAGLWLTVGSLSLWSLRLELVLLHQYFTWTALRYGLAYHRWAALGLGLCLGLTVALLVAESRYLLFGLAKEEQQRLETWLRRINRQGPGHRLWTCLHRSKSG